MCESGSQIDKADPENCKSGDEKREQPSGSAYCLTSSGHSKTSLRRLERNRRSSRSLKSNRSNSSNGSKSQKYNRSSGSSKKKLSQKRRSSRTGRSVTRRASTSAERVTTSAKVPSDKGLKRWAELSKRISKDDDSSHPANTRDRSEFVPPRRSTARSASQPKRERRSFDTTGSGKGQTTRRKRSSSGGRKTSSKPQRPKSSESRKRSQRQQRDSSLDKKQKAKKFSAQSMRAEMMEIHSQHSSGKSKPPRCPIGNLGSTQGVRNSACLETSRIMSGNVVEANVGRTDLHEHELESLRRLSSYDLSRSHSDIACEHEVCSGSKPEELGHTGTAALHVSLSSIEMPSLSAINRSNKMRTLLARSKSLGGNVHLPKEKDSGVRRTQSRINAETTIAAKPGYRSSAAELYATGAALHASLSSIDASSQPTFNKNNPSRRRSPARSKSPRAKKVDDFAGDYQETLYDTARELAALPKADYRSSAADLYAVGAALHASLSAIDMPSTPAASRDKNKRGLFGGPSFSILGRASKK